MDKLITPVIGVLGLSMAMIGQAAPVETSIFNVIEKYGVTAGLVLVFVWWTRQREVTMTARMEQNEDFIQNKLLERVDKSTEVIAGNTTAMQEMAAAIREMKH